MRGVHRPQRMRGRVRWYLRGHIHRGVCARGLDTQTHRMRASVRAWSCLFQVHWYGKDGTKLPVTTYPPVTTSSGSRERRGGGGGGRHTTILSTSGGDTPLYSLLLLITGAAGLSRSWSYDRITPNSERGTGLGGLAALLTGLLTLLPTLLLTLLPTLLSSTTRLDDNSTIDSAITRNTLMVLDRILRQNKSERKGLIPH